MIDPISAVFGALSLTHMLVSVVFSTFEKVAGTHQDFDKCTSRLRSHRTTHLASMKRLEGWRRKWLAIASQRDFVAVWGDKGWADIEDTIKNIEDADLEIREFLFGKTSFKETRVKRHPSDAWAAFVSHGAENVFSNFTPELTDSLRQLSHCVEASRPAHLKRSQERSSRLPMISKSKLKAANFAILGPGRIEEPMARLKQQISNLDSLAEDYFKEEQQLDEESLDSAQEIMQTRVRAETFWHTMSDLCIELGSSTALWALLLSPVDITTHCRFRNDFVELDFLHTSATLEWGAPGHKVSKKYYFDNRPQVAKQLASDLVRDIEINGSPARISRTMKSKCLSIVRRNGENRLTLQRATVLERAKAAFCVALWATFLAHQSEWMNNICTCCIRYAILETAARDTPSVESSGTIAESVLSRIRVSEIWGLKGVPSFFVNQDHCKTCPCFGERKFDRPHLHLGLVLAELGLGQPVNVRVHGSQTMFEVQQDEDRYEPITERALLSRLEEGTVWPYSKAVSQCLKWDRQYASPDRLGPQDVKRYAEKVVVPLNEHFKLVRDGVEGHPGFYRTVRRKEMELSEEGLTSDWASVGH